MSKIKLLICVVMTFVLCIMTLGYAALQERIDLEVEASIDSTYRVEITSVAQGTASGDARSTAAPQYNGLNANFYVGLTNTTDIITYNIEITNYSTVDIKLNELSITVDGSNYIKAQKNGIRNGDIMLAGSTKNITLKVKYNGEAQSSEQTGTVTLNFNFTRLKGGVGEVAEEHIDLPEGYRLCEYLESDGGQYINTGILNDYQNVEVTYQRTAEGNVDGVLLGSRKADKSDDFTIWTNYSKGTLAFHIAKGNNNGSTDTSWIYKNDPLGKHLIEIKEGNILIDKTLIYSFNYVNRGAYYPVYLFAYNNCGRADSRKFIGRIYEAIFFDEYLNEIWHGVPVLDDNDVACIYDIESGDTFYNQGEGTFLYKLKE